MKITGKQNRTYNERAKNATKMHNLNHAGYLLILIVLIDKKIRKHFGFKIHTFTQTDLCILLIEFLCSYYGRSVLTISFVKAMGFSDIIITSSRARLAKLGLLSTVEGSNKYVITALGDEVIAFACRVSIRTAGLFRNELAKYVDSREELFI